MMRTTLTIDEQVGAALQETARRMGKPYKAVVNEALRLGLHAMAHPSARPYHLVPSALGGVRTGLNLDKALAIADALENDAIAQKLMLRK